MAKKKEPRPASKPADTPPEPPPEPPVPTWHYVLTNGLVGRVEGLVQAATEEEARKMIADWLMEGLRINEG